MADVKIAQLLEATTVSDTDLFVVEDNADTKKITKANLVSFLGSIVESGSNVNGSYVKFADGTMICFLVENLSSVAISVTAGQLRRSETITWTFPTQFISGPVFFGNAIGSTIMGYVPPVVLSPISCGYRILNPTSATVDLKVLLIAFGRYK